MLLTALMILPACSAAPETAAEQRDRRRPVQETRTGVPGLMDLPGIGWLFGSRTVRR